MTETMNNNEENKAEDVSRGIELLSTLNPATVVAVYGRDGEPAEQLVTDFENVIVLGKNFNFQVMKCFLIQICSIDANGVANPVVHVDMAPPKIIKITFVESNN
jgi:hypothetical protein